MRMFLSMLVRIYTTSPIEFVVAETIMFLAKHTILDLESGIHNFGIGRSFRVIMTIWFPRTILRHSVTICFLRATSRLRIVLRTYDQN